MQFLQANLILPAASTQKLNVRGYLPVESFGCERDIDGDPTEVREWLLSRMTAVRTSNSFTTASVH